LLLTEWVEGHNTFNALLRFKVFAYCDHGNPSPSPGFNSRGP